MIEYKLFPNSTARAFTPTASESDAKPGFHGNLAQESTGDWSWKPYRYDSKQRYRFAVTGPRCTCTLLQPVGTSCVRHRN